MYRPRSRSAPARRSGRASRRRRRSRRGGLPIIARPTGDVRPPTQISTSSMKLPLMLLPIALASSRPAAMSSSTTAAARVLRARSRQAACGVVRNRCVARSSRAAGVIMRAFSRSASDMLASASDMRGGPADAPYCGCAARRSAAIQRVRAAAAWMESRVPHRADHLATAALRKRCGGAALDLLARRERTPTTRSLRRWRT